MVKHAEFESAEEVYTVDTLPAFSHSREKTDAEKMTDDLANALRDDTSGFVTIHKEDNGRSMHVERIPSDKYDVGQLLDYLQINYGGGDYRIRVYSGGKITANKLISIAVKKVTQEGKSLAGHGELASILEVITQQNNRVIEALSFQEKKDPMEEMTKMFQMMTMMREAMGIQNQQPINPLSQLKDTLGILESVGVTINGQAEKEDEGFGGLLEKMAPLVTAAVSQPQQRPMNNPQPRPEKRENPMFGNIMIKAGLQTLLKAAKKGSDPAMYAEMIVDQFPEEKIREFITGEKAAEKLLAFCPPIKEHTKWFDELAEHVKALLGLDSRFSDLYSDDDDVINADIETNIGANNEGGTTGEI